MRLNRILFALAVPFFAVAVFRAASQPPAPVTSAPTYVPDYTHANEPLPPGFLAWDETTKSVDATNGQDFARFVFSFTNVAMAVTLGQATNVSYTTNFTIVTNQGFWAVFSGRKYSAIPSVTSNTNVFTVTNSATPIQVTILTVHPSCGCTTAELPPTPWQLPPGTNSSIRVAVNLAGKSGIVFKTVTVTTDKGKMDLMLKINISAAPPPQPMSEADRAMGVAAAKADRQAVFKGDCVNCHAKNTEGKYGQQLYAVVCAVCHDAEHRASMVPDLHNLKDPTPTSEEFWRAWITSGKPGTLMPAFATSQGGPLNEMQIGSLAAFLNVTIPPRAPAPAAK